MIAPHIGSQPKSVWLPAVARLESLKPECPGVASYHFSFVDPATAGEYRFQPGQFNMLYLPGCGESAISLSSDAAQPERLVHTVRVAGNVTLALSRLQVGDQIGLRGPFGNPWPIQACRGRDIVLACGGIGLAPLRPVLYHIVRHRADYGRVFLLYGARTPKDLLYTEEFAAWRQADIEVEVTVDIAEAGWEGSIGVVPILFYRLRLQPQRTTILTCGPEIMMRFVIFEALARKVPAKQIYLSMERHMSCAVKLCGQCQLGPVFVCRDGPVFTYEQMEPYLRMEDL